MAPEVIQGQPGDGRTDIYALGILLYEMLAGHVPFRGRTPVATLLMHVHEPPPPLQRANPDVPAWLVAVVDRALAKSPQARYQTAGEFAEALRARRVEKVWTPAAKVEEPVEEVWTPEEDVWTPEEVTHPRVAPAPAARERRRNIVPFVIAGIALLILTLLAVGAYLLLNGG
jgi:serine/threonine protein kinase